MVQDTQPIDGTFSQLLSEGERPTPSPVEKQQTNEPINERTLEEKNKGTNERSNERTNEPGKERKNKRTKQDSKVASGESDPAYSITIPSKREQLRSTFDIFKDQKMALNKLQLAIAEQEGSRPKLGDMVKDALDNYIRDKAKSLGTFSIRRTGDDPTKHV